MIYLVLRDTVKRRSVVRLHRQAAVVVVAVVGDHDVQHGHQWANLQRQHRAKRKGVVDAGAWHAACLQAIRGLAPLAGLAPSFTAETRTYGALGDALDVGRAVGMIVTVVVVVGEETWQSQIASRKAGGRVCVTLATRSTDKP